ncbi:MAG: hypothetical protein KDD02_13475 [Phaeodactylibacter sp.]|nr:hypothetical protein [Phaeodactylibacter sp.]MCB9300901.1 hypothetical protein [Lewinellaceae bacterium]
MGKQNTFPFRKVEKRTPGWPAGSGKIRKLTAVLQFSAIAGKYLKIRQKGLSGY